MGAQEDVLDGERGVVRMKREDVVEAAEPEVQGLRGERGLADAGGSHDDGDARSPESSQVWPSLARASPRPMIDAWGLCRGPGRRLRSWVPAIHLRAAPGAGLEAEGGVAENDGHGVVGGLS